MLAAVVSWWADLSWPALAAVMALAWAIAASVEWLAWQPGVPRLGLGVSERMRPGPPLEAPTHPQSDPARELVSRAEPPESESRREPTPPVAEERGPDPPESGPPTAEEREPKAEPEPEPAPPVDEPAAEAAVGSKRVPPGEPAARQPSDEPTQPSGDDVDDDVVETPRERRSWLSGVRRRREVDLLIPVEDADPALPESEAGAETGAGTLSEDSGPPSEPDGDVPEAPRERRSWLSGVRRRREVDLLIPVEDAEPPEEGPGRERQPAPSDEPEVESGPPPLRAVASPPALAESEAPPEGASPEPDLGGTVVRMASRRPREPREWNLWDLESLARDQAHVDPARAEEWRYLFVHLRQFADANGDLPTAFDGLVQESFEELLEALDPA